MDSTHSHGGGGGSNSPPPFLLKTYEMVDDRATDAVVSWGPTNASFIVWNPPDFARDLLPKYFKHNNFSSFIRQLNTYGFRKIDPDQWEFANEDFIRGRTHLLKNIHRRKPVHSHSLQNQVNGPLAESERRELEEEIERLKYEKSVLLADLQKCAQQQYGMNWHIQSLEDRLRIMEQRQKNLIASLGQILQGRGFVSNFMQEPDHLSKKRRVPQIDFFDEDPTIEEHQIAYLQTMGRERPDIFPIHPVDAEPFEKMELTLVSLEKLFQAANQASNEEMYPGAAASCPPSVVLTEIRASSTETEIDLQSPAKPQSSSPCIGDIHSSPELAESASYVESPALPLTEIHEDTRKIADVDMNSETATTDVNSSHDETIETAVSDEPSRVNDVFWERFLTETPQPSDVRKAQLERQDADDTRERTEERKEQTIGVQGNIFHNPTNVDQITEKMGHLTSAERA